MQGLGLGDPQFCLVHFEAARKLLSSKLSSAVIEAWDADLLSLYRIVAECVVFNFATMLPLYRTKDLSMPWASASFDGLSSFDCLFYENDGQQSSSTSPFFGGFYRLWNLMLRSTVLHHRIVLNEVTEPIAQELIDMADSMKIELDDTEKQIHLWEVTRPRDSSLTKLYKAQHFLNLCATRIYLCKILNNTVTAQCVEVQREFAKAVGHMKLEEHPEQRSLSLRWPLTILACAASTDQDFAFLAKIMDDIASTVIHANSSMLKSARQTLTMFRQRGPDVAQLQQGISTTLDFVLEPRLLGLAPSLTS